MGQRCADPPGLCADSPGTLAVRLGAAPLVQQVAWEAELPSRGEGLGLLDNPKSAWSSHAKAAASGKDTRVLNLQNKERRTRDSLFFPSLGTKVHIFARYSSCECEALGALESCNLPLRLHSLQSCNSMGPDCAATQARAHQKAKQVTKTGTYETRWTSHPFSHTAGSRSGALVRRRGSRELLGKMKNNFTPLSSILVVRTATIMTVMAI